jgi:hypothetical protein
MRLQSLKRIFTKYGFETQLRLMKIQRCTDVHVMVCVFDIV